jgi:hypothetical protein
MFVDYYRCEIGRTEPSSTPYGAVEEEMSPSCRNFPISKFFSFISFSRRAVCSAFVDEDASFSYKIGDIEMDELAIDGKPYLGHICAMLELRE